jgi:hypothetical protein
MSQFVDLSDAIIDQAGEGAGLADVFAAALSDESREAFARELALRTTYGADSAFPGWVVRYERDRSCTPGRVINREFVPAEAPQSRHDAAD